MLREYLQYKILEIVFESEFSSKLSFLGGTCLRIVHGNSRFSEDLDFDNFNLSENNFNEIGNLIKKKLSAQGYDVEIKNVIVGAFHCYVRFPKLLFNQGLSGHKEEKILIQLDTEPQNYDFIPEKIIINKFDVFTSINTTPKELLLAQKYYALINRKRKKGRDVFDIIYLSKSAKPDFGYLEQKLNITTEYELKLRVLSELSKISLVEIAKDVNPFLFKSSDTKQILMFKEFIEQTLGNRNS
jgi:predicted nucleotidyltransferase component of viral defense system